MTSPTPNYVCNLGGWSDPGLDGEACGAVGDAPTAAGHYPGNWFVALVIAGEECMFQCPDGITISYSGSMNITSNNAIRIV